MNWAVYTTLVQTPDSNYMHRVIEVSGDRRVLGKWKGFMTIADGSTVELAREPLDDIGTVIVTSRSATYSHSLLTALAERNTPLVLCDSRFLPTAWVWPVETNHIQAKRMAAQANAKKPIGKQIWQEIVKAKINNQASLLRTLGKNADSLTALVGRVRSGDPENVEAYAARVYWGLLFGPDFRRDRNADGILNGLLNYGYTIIRATAARAIAGAGLHPSLGVHHRSQYDHLQLADDMMEPFRPLADHAAASLSEQGFTELSPEVKRTPSSSAK